ncbi:MAG: ribonuclease HII [Actinomycetia bacterium]|nr:ribonuclease HII [Actinomycetes bacterium]MCP4959365.1 ribonuclease HII [Actinomycetes bacterium]
MAATKAPGLRHERALWGCGEIVVGIDEVGRGSWAGPLTLAAVVLPSDRRVNNVRDSKQLSTARREHLYDKIVDWVTSWSVGHASALECDQLGMSAAQRLAASRTLDGLGVDADHVLVDGPWDFVGTHRTTCIVKGDRVSLSIAAASVIAKVTRDRIMVEEATHFPAYGFESNKGYPAPAHVAALAGYGPSSIHRRSWAFMDSLPWSALDRYDREAAAQPALF